MKALPFIKWLDSVEFVEMGIQICKEKGILYIGFSDMTDYAIDLYSAPFSPDMLNPESPECLFAGTSMQGPGWVRVNTDREGFDIWLNNGSIEVKRVFIQESISLPPIKTLDDFISCLRLYYPNTHLSWNDRAIEMLKGGQG